jgi:hypothetical protein
MVTLSKLGQLGKVQPHTLAVAKEFVARFPILQTWGYNPKSDGEHGEGRALDLMVFTDNNLHTSESLGERIYKAAW